jgi:tetratricopeptide (TPR) repeat protein
MIAMFVCKARLWISLTVGAVWLCGVQVLAQSPDTGAVERYAEQGQRALAEGRYSEAEQAFEKLRALEPGMAEVHANLGLIYFQERKFEQAVPALRQAMKLKPSLSKTDSLLAMSLSELGHYDEALPGLEKSFHRSTDPAIKRMSGLQLERAYTGLKRDAKAVEVALELNRLYPDDPEVLYNNGKIYGNFAFLNIQKLAQVAPNSVWRHLAAAEAQESQGAYHQAIAEYREVLRVEPQRPGIHYRIGRTLLARFWERHLPEDSTEAEKEFAQELQVDPSNANAAYELGEMHRKAKQIDEAQQYFEQALDHYPTFEEAHLALATVLLQKNQPEQALVHAQKAAAANPGNEVCWYRISQIQGRLGNVAEQQKALAEFQRLHDQSTRQKGFDPAVAPSEVTKQAVDPNAVQ